MKISTILLLVLPLLGAAEFRPAQAAAPAAGTTGPARAGPAASPGAAEAAGMGGPYEPAVPDLSTVARSAASQESWRVTVDPREARRFAPPPRPRFNAVTFRF